MNEGWLEALGQSLQARLSADGLRVPGDVQWLLVDDGMTRPEDRERVYLETAERQPSIDLRNAMLAALQDVKGSYHEQLQATGYAWDTSLLSAADLAQIVTDRELAISASIVAPMTQSALDAAVAAKAAGGDYVVDELTGAVTILDPSGRVHDYIGAGGEGRPGQILALELLTGSPRGGPHVSPLDYLAAQQELGQASAAADDDRARSGGLGPGEVAALANGDIVVTFPDGSTRTWKHDAMRQDWEDEAFGSNPLHQAQDGQGDDQGFGAESGSGFDEARGDAFHQDGGGDASTGQIGGRSGGRISDLMHQFATPLQQRSGGSQTAGGSSGGGSIEVPGARQVADAGEDDAEAARRRTDDTDDGRADAPGDVALGHKTAAEQALASADQWSGTPLADHFRTLAASEAAAARATAAPAPEAPAAGVQTGSEDIAPLRNAGADRTGPLVTRNDGEPSDDGEVRAAVRREPGSSADWSGGAAAALDSAILAAFATSMQRENGERPDAAASSRPDETQRDDDVGSRQANSGGRQEALAGTHGSNATSDRVAVAPHGGSAGDGREPAASDSHGHLDDGSLSTGHLDPFDPAGSLGSASGGPGGDGSRHADFDDDGADA